MRYHKGNCPNSSADKFFRQCSTKVPPGFHRGSTRVAPAFHQGSTRVPPGFHQGSTGVLQGLRGVVSTKKSTACCWGYHLSFFLQTYI